MRKTLTAAKKVTTAMKTATTARKRGCKLFLKKKIKNLSHPYSLYGALLTALLTAYFFVDLTACLTADVTAALNRLDPRLHLLAPTTQQHHIFFHRRK